jgi:16S rRNA (cytidine1402-2'-O)-methyltransferase
VLVAAARAAGHPVVPLPGPSSALAALSVAGDTPAAVLSLSASCRPRAASGALRWQRAGRGRAQVLFEAPHRIQALLAELAADAPQRADHAVPRADQAVRDHPHAAGASRAGLAGGRREPRARRIRAGAARAAPEAAEDALPPEAALRTLQVLLRELPLKQAVRWRPN